jgi:nitroreductase
MKKRSSTYSIVDIILNRWSPRAMNGLPISDEQLMRLFEAARWAPSSYNNQPWRFVYAKRDTNYWDSFFNLLVPLNQDWCKNAAVLVIIISDKLFSYNQKESRTHSFDTGAAWQNMALQGFADGLVVHGMEGFDYARARELLQLPDRYTIEAMAVIGNPGDISTLAPALQEREFPSDRKSLDQITFEGIFKQ